MSAQASAHRESARASMARVRARRRALADRLEQAVADVASGVGRKLGARLELLGGARPDGTITVLVCRPVSEHRWEVMRIDVCGAGRFALYRLRPVHLYRSARPEHLESWRTGVWIHYSGLEWQLAQPITPTLTLSIGDDDAQD